MASAICARWFGDAGDGPVYEGGGALWAGLVRRGESCVVAESTRARVTYSASSADGTLLTRASCSLEKDLDVAIVVVCGFVLWRSQDALLCVASSFM